MPSNYDGIMPALTAKLALLALWLEDTNSNHFRLKADKEQGRVFAEDLWRAISYIDDYNDRNNIGGKQ